MAHGLKNISSQFRNSENFYFEKYCVLKSNPILGIKLLAKCHDFISAAKVLGATSPGVQSKFWFLSTFVFQVQLIKISPFYIFMALRRK